jgi:hypothetical protein
MSSDRTGEDDAPEPSDEKMYTGEPLETEHGTYRPQQQNAAGKDNIEGGGEWPDPATPPQAPAPGAVDGQSGDDDG